MRGAPDVKAVLNILKWFLFLPVAVYPHLLPHLLVACIPYGPVGTPSLLPPYLIPLWIGLAAVCALAVLFLRSRWTAQELSIAVCAVKCSFLRLMPLALFMVIYHFPAIFWLSFLPSCIVGLAAVLRCRRAGAVSTPKAVVLGLLQFVVIADLASTAFLCVVSGPTYRARKSAPAFQLLPNRPGEAMAVMREVAAWGRGRGLRVWPEERLTEEALFTDEAGPENFYIGQVKGDTACAFILQWSDREFWPQAAPGEAGYLHKLCVRRKFAHRGMTGRVVEALKDECRRHGANYLRLDTGYGETAVRDIYLAAGFDIVKTLERDGTPVMLLYEMKL